MLFNWSSRHITKNRRPSRRHITRRQTVKHSSLSSHVELLESRQLLTSLLFDAGQDGANERFLDETGRWTWVEDDLPLESEVAQDSSQIAAGIVTNISGNDDISDVNDGTYDLSKTFSLHSHATSNFTIYLDFDGHTTQNTFWNSAFNNNNDIATDAWSYDSDRSSFSNSEQQMIQRIWASVAEDFAPFDINVTTQDPGADALRKSNSSDSQWGIRVVVGPNSFYAPAGGVAYIGSFNWSSDTPTFVFNTGEIGIREAVSHEVGHTLGLYHDGTDSVSYYDGHGSGDTSWSPIMGVGYYTSISQWSRGEYLNANNQEDDLSIITTQNGFGYRADDVGNSYLAASALAQNGTSLSGQGLIERNTDSDYFSFTTGSGTISINIETATYAANLDVLAKLYDINGNLIATSNPSTGLDANFNLTVSAGQYYISIEGTGTGTTSTGYSDYASLGNYWISGTAIASQNQVPQSQNDIALLDEDQTIIIDVLDNDTDPNGDILTLMSTSHGANGVTEIVNGKVRYTPNSNFFGADSFTYTIRDAYGETSTATVTVIIEAVPEIVTMTGPSSLTTGKTPTIAWNSLSDAAHYELLAYRVSTGQQILYQNNISSGTSYTMNFDLADGDYQFFVRATNSSGKSGSWGKLELTIATPPPENITIVGATSSTTITPTIDWNIANNADYYQIQIYSVTRGQLFDRDDHVTITEFTTSSPMENDTYIAYVRGMNSQNNSGEWAGYQWTVSVFPGDVTITGPGKVISDLTPTITWDAADNADHYELHIYSVTQGKLLVHDSNVSGTSFTSTALTDDSYVVFVRAVNQLGTLGEWSSYNFSIEKVPETVTITGPIGTMTNNQPTITWSAVDNADYYDFYVYRLSGPAEQVARNVNTSDTSFTPSSTWANGSYRVYILSFSAGGLDNGVWASHDFTINTAAPKPETVTITGPTGTTNSSTPTITWNTATNTDYYELHVYSTTRGQLITIDRHLSATSFTPSSAWGNDGYRVYVRAVSAIGVRGEWTSRDFTISTPKPENVVMTGPTGTITNSQPTITWNAAANADHYEFHVYSTTRGQLVIMDLHLSATSFTPSSTWSNDDYRVFVRGVSATGIEGDWTTYDFTITAAKPGTVTMTGPIGTTSDSTPTITWNAAANAGSYDILIYSTTRGQLVAPATNVTGTSFTVSSAFANDNYCVYVRGVSNNQVLGDWTRLDFSIQTSAALSETEFLDMFWELASSHQKEETVAEELWNI